VNKQIAKMSDHVIVCGYGRNGRQAVALLLTGGESVVIIDMGDQFYDEVVEHDELVFVHGDATQDETLERAKIHKARALIAALPNDANNLFVVLSAREMNSKIKIISRASKVGSDAKLRRAGADNVIMPDKVGGTKMAELVTQPDTIEFLEKLMEESQDVGLEEIVCEDIHENYLQKTLGEMQLYEKSGANVIGLKVQNSEYIFNPSPATYINRSDKLFVLGTQKQIDKLKKALKTRLMLGK